MTPIINDGNDNNDNSNHDDDDIDGDDDDNDDDDEDYDVNGDDDDDDNDYCQYNLRMISESICSLSVNPLCRNVDGNACSKRDCYSRNYLRYSKLNKKRLYHYEASLKNWRLILL